MDWQDIRNAASAATIATAALRLADIRRRDLQALVDRLIG
jgi:hypothetical protein